MLKWMQADTDGRAKIVRKHLESNQEKEELSPRQAANERDITLWSPTNSSKANVTHTNDGADDQHTDATGFEANLRSQLA